MHRRHPREGKFYVTDQMVEVDIDISGAGERQPDSRSGDDTAG